MDLLQNETVFLDYDCCSSSGGGLINDTGILSPFDDFFGNSSTRGSNEASLDPRPQWVFLSLIVIPVWMLGGNLLVLLAVLYQRNLQNLSNRVIASLAFTDLLLGLVVVPLSIYQLVQGKWVLGFSVCLIWTGSDVILSTASIMHLCAIALYRYHGIAHPLHVRSYATQGRRVTVLVVPAWTISVALSIPFIVQGIIDRSYVLQPLDPPTDDPVSGSLVLDDEPHVQCGIFNQTFAIYSSLVSFFIPLAIMVFADIRSIQILRKNIKLPLLLNYGYIQPRRMVSKSPVEALGETTLESPEEDSVRAATSDATSCQSPPPTARQLVSTITMTSQFDAMATADKGVAYDGGGGGRNGTSSELELLRCNSSAGTTPSAGSGGLTPGGGDSAIIKRRSRSRSMIYLDMLASCGKAKVNGRERRAEKTLIWVFASFIVLWLPFFCINLAYGLCGDRCSIPGELFQVFTWLGYLSSGVNPCIYTLLNKDFRTAFRNLLLCRHEQLTRTTAHCSFGPVSASNGTLRGLNTP